VTKSRPGELGGGSAWNYSDASSPATVPRPFADLLLEWINSRDNMNTATNRGSRWLFPGRRAAQPVNPYSLAASINDLGIPTTAGAGRDAASLAAPPLARDGRRGRNRAAGRHRAATTAALSVPSPAAAPGG
jgi:hypothetical protein